MGRHRTTGTGLFAALAILVLGGTAAGGQGPGGPVAETMPAGSLVAGAPIVFPLLSRVRYGDDFGDPRPNGAHEGNDILGDWRAPVLAAESGRVQWWTTSARAGCMLYLHGGSGTTYLYVHLNDDRTRRRDNRGGCRLGVAYAVKDGARVAAGQQIGYNGDSGDAEGTYHLHFEVRRHDRATSPFPFLEAADRYLFPTPVGKRFSLGLRGTPLAAGNGVLELSVSAVRWWPGGAWTPIDPRTVEVAVPPSASIDPSVRAAVASPTRRALARSATGSVTLFIGATAVTREAQLGSPGTLVAARVATG